MKTYHDIEGDGGSRILDQVLEQRAAVVERMSSIGRIVAIGSGKGGVGKSTITMQLAHALRARGKRVSILDADINGPSQARMAGLLDAPLVPSADGLVVPTNADGIGVVSLGTLVPEGRAIEFESVASGESHTWRATREFSALGELLAAVHWGERDALLVDLPPGAERTVQYADYFGPSTPFVLVTVPSDVARGVVARSVDALRSTNNPLLGYVENMAGYACEGCDEIRPLFPESATHDLGIPVLGRIPFDPRLAAAADRGEGYPVAEGAVARALRETADACWSAVSSLPKAAPVAATTEE